MPTKEVNITSFLTKHLVQAVGAIARNEKRSMFDVYASAIDEFYEAWRSGDTSRAYFGNPPGSRHTTIWVSERLRGIIREIAETDRVNASAVVRDAARWYCERRGYDILRHELPPLPSGPRPMSVRELEAT